MTVLLCFQSFLGSLLLIELLSFYSFKVCSLCKDFLDLSILHLWCTNCCLLCPEVASLSLFFHCKQVVHAVLLLCCECCTDCEVAIKKSEYSMTILVLSNFYDFVSLLLSLFFWEGASSAIFNTFFLVYGNYWFQVEVKICSMHGPVILFVFLWFSLLAVAACSYIFFSALNCTMF